MASSGADVDVRGVCAYLRLFNHNLVSLEDIDNVGVCVCVCVCVFFCFVLFRSAGESVV